MHKESLSVSSEARAGETLLDLVPGSRRRLLVLIRLFFWQCDDPNLIAQNRLEVPSAPPPLLLGGDLKPRIVIVE